MAPVWSGPSAAQGDADGWDFVVAPYLLVPHMNGDVAVRSIPAVVDVGPSDIFENLDFGAMLYLEMANPDWAITLDGLYMDLGASTLSKIIMCDSREPAAPPSPKGERPPIRVT